MKKILFLLQLFPLILAAIRSLEEVIPLPGQGKTKLDLILDTVKVAYDSEESVRKEFSWDKLAGAVVTVVARVVGTLNALGIFQKGTQGASAA